MPATPGVSIHYISAALHHARPDHATALAVLEKAGIAPALLDDPRARISNRQYADVIVPLMRLSNDEFLFQGGRRRTPYGAFAMMCHSIIHEPTLRPALLRGLHFYEIFTGDIHFRLRAGEERTEVSVRWDDPGVDPFHASTESMLTVIHRLCSWLIGQRIPLAEATFAYPPPAHVDHYHTLFHCPLRFGQSRNAIVFSAHYLNYPLMQDEQSLKTLLRNVPSMLFVPPVNPQLLTARIRALLGKDFTQEFPEFEDVAARLGMTPQTLRRRLKEEDNSYQAIKDQLRRDAAIYYLTRPQLGIADIAQMMGFSEPSTFHRAFKKWTGLTPGEYRNGLGRQA
jgi:AraC-like DNA-binding protein